MDKRYQVFISSTFTDLRDERKAIIEGLLNAKYIPSGMEMFAASNDEQFKYIKKIIDTCDYYILIVGARYGSINSSTGKSFTEQEYDYAVEKGIPVLVFLHNDPYNLPAEKREDDKRSSLDSFRKKVSENRLCKMWSTSAELISSVIISLGEEVANNPQSGWTRGDIGDNVELLSQINELRIENGRLIAEVADLKKKVEEANRRDDLAFGNDEFELKGVEETHVDNYFTTERRVSFTLSWNEIFSSVAPYMFVPIRDFDFEKNLLDSLNSLYPTCDKSLSKLDDHCIRLIKIQFIALGLLEIVPITLNGGHVVEGMKLTDKGEKYLIDAMSIKK